jgi:hypothetical protein
VALGRKGGKKGGIARAKSLSQQERIAIARKAARARWRDHDGGKRKTVEGTHAARSPVVRATRYCLLNNTYVDLALPYDKIGVPFDSTSPASTLTHNEKTKVIIELSKCEPAIRAGNLDLLELALEICRRCQVQAPVWLLPHALETINRFLELNSRTRQKRLQREIHQVRWPPCIICVPTTNLLGKLHMRQQTKNCTTLVQAAAKKRSGQAING